jgi:hypothetical protein
MGIGDQGITVEEAKSIAKIMQGAGADSIHVRTHWLGQHQASYNQELVFFPETAIPIKDFPRELDWSRKGPGVLLPLAAEIKKAVSCHDRRRVECLIGEKVLREESGFDRYDRPFLPIRICKQSGWKIGRYCPLHLLGNCKLYNQPDNAY